MTLDKVVGSVQEAVADIPAGASLAVGGFGLCGIPMVLIQALHGAGVDRLSLVSNNCGVDDWGLGVLLAEQRIAKIDTPSRLLVTGSWFTRRTSSRSAAGSRQSRCAVVAAKEAHSS